MSALGALPFVRWASRFDRGRVRLRGRHAALGPIDVALAFERGRIVHLAGVPPEALPDLLDRLHDPAVTVEAWTDAGLVVKVLPGLTAVVPPGEAVRLDAASEGPPEAPRLVRALEVSVGGTGVRVRLPGSRWITALASLSIRRAALAPDGDVALDAGGSGLADRLLGAGLRLASRELTDLVRTSPRFAKVRAFLRARPLGPEVG